MRQLVQEEEEEEEGEGWSEEQGWSWSPRRRNSALWLFDCELAEFNFAEIKEKGERGGDLQGVARTKGEEERRQCVRGIRKKRE